jgi:hypothetical protein
MYLEIRKNISNPENRRWDGPIGWMENKFTLVVRTDYSQKFGNFSENGKI